MTKQEAERHLVKDYEDFVSCGGTRADAIRILRDVSFPGVGTSPEMKRAADARFQEHLREIASTIPKEVPLADKPAPKRKKHWIVCFGGWRCGSARSPTWSSTIRPRRPGNRS